MNLKIPSCLLATKLVIGLFINRSHAEVRALQHQVICLFYCPQLLFTRRVSDTFDYSLRIVLAKVCHTVHFDQSK